MSESIPYQLRISPRARYVYLRYSRQHGLQVIVPRRYNLAKLPALLQAKRAWIEKVKVRMAQMPAVDQALPAKIELPAIAENWQVEYVAQAGRGIRVETPEPYRLRVTGVTASELGCRRALRRWLLARAGEVLVPWLHQVAQETGLSFSGASVRLQRTRWGSCSPSRRISLNGKLLFLRPELVRYLLLHELSHTVQMNHSPRYWRLVGQLAPDYRRLDNEMRSAMEMVPAWVG